MNLCDPTNRPRVLDAIVRDIRAHGNALTAATSATGIFSWPWPRRTFRRDF